MSSVFQAQKFAQGDEVGLDVYHRLLAEFYIVV